MNHDSPPGGGDMPAAVPRRTLVQLMVQPRIAKAALRVSLLVGTVLNLVNNGERLWTGHGVNLWQMAMNYVVPFCVSAYSAARVQASRPEGR